MSNASDTQSERDWWQPEVEAMWPTLSSAATNAIVDRALAYDSDSRDHIGSLYTIDDGCDLIEADNGDVAVAFHYRMADRPDICDPGRIAVEAVVFAPDGTIVKVLDLG
jgi:hypothetical protein